ncbi:hypothetical protein AAFF_G00032070, partial [Aldrovandia affinis]
MERAGSIQLDIPDFSNSVLSHLNQLRMQGRLCDIVVNVQGQSFRAHKVVLAASSPYFRDHMSLGEMSTVSISVIRNPTVFEQLLSFCYTGRLCLQLADIISYPGRQLPADAAHHRPLHPDPGGDPLQDQRGRR